MTQITVNPIAQEFIDKAEEQFEEIKANFTTTISYNHHLFNSYQISTYSYSL